MDRSRAQLVLVTKERNQAQRAANTAATVLITEKVVQEKLIALSKQLVVRFTKTIA